MFRLRRKERQALWLKGSLRPSVPSPDCSPDVRKMPEAAGPIHPSFIRWRFFLRYRRQISISRSPPPGVPPPAEVHPHVMSDASAGFPHYTEHPA
eukprot:9475204-Heterocapsa_arctica.AAC.1